MLGALAWLAARSAALTTMGAVGVGRWAVVRATGLLTGSWAWAVIAVSVVVGGYMLWAWLDPPERTWTSAEIRADRLARENEMLRRAIVERRSIERDRDQALTAATNTATRLGEENEALRQTAGNRDIVVFDDADPWLQRKRSRHGAGKAGTDRR